MSLCKYLTKYDLLDYLEEGMQPIIAKDLFIDPEGFICIVFGSNKVWYPINQFLEDYCDNEMIKESAKVVNYLEGLVDEPDYRVYVEIDEDYY